MDKSLIKKLVDIGTDYNTAVQIVGILNKGWFPHNCLTVRQAIVIGWL